MWNSAICLKPDPFIMVPNAVGHLNWIIGLVIHKMKNIFLSHSRGAFLTSVFKNFVWGL